jgi:hypothetical protein
MHEGGTFNNVLRDGFSQMKITEKQLMVLFDLAVWFSQLNMTWRVCAPPFTKELIEQMVNDIYNQQSNQLVDIK